MSRFGHFSDIHFNYSNYDTNTLRECLIKKLSELPALDAIFITGDIFYQGKTDTESIQVVKNFIVNMANAARCDIDKVFICAGNHDLTRNKARASVLQLISDDYAENKVLNTDGYESLIYDDVCAPFNSICSIITGKDSQKSIHRFISLNDINLAILNTAVFAGQTYPGQKDAKKALEDTNLFICDRKFEELKARIDEDIDKNKLTIFLGHHSPDCFEEKEKERLVKYLDDVECDFYLCGHIHKPSTGVLENTKATYRITCGGPFKDNYNKPTFVIGDFNSQTQTLNMELYCYENSWEIFNQALSPWTHGKWERNIERLKKLSEETEKQQNMVNQTITQTRGIIKSSISEKDLYEKYYKYILNQTSEIQLDGLPTNQEDIRRSHKLNQIYIPEHFLEYKWVKSREQQPFSYRGLERDIVGLIAADTPVKSVVLGDPGAGKTTFIRWLAATCCSTETLGKEEIYIKNLDFFPILIRCRDIKETTIWDNIRNTVNMAEWFPENCVEQLVALIKKHLDKGNALLLIDGLDEINDDKKRKDFIKQIHLFIRENSKANVIVTSRIKGYSIISDGSFDDFTQWTICDLQDKEINKLCENWYCLVYGDCESNKKKAQILSDKIITDKRLRNLAKNPLMLTTLLLVERRVGELPNKRAGLYYEAVKVLLESWNSHVHDKIDLDEAKYQLAYVAFCMMKADSSFSSTTGISKTYISAKKLKNLLHAVRRDHSNLVYSRDSYTKIIDTVEQRSAIFYKVGMVETPDGHEEPVYCFQHLLFEEYLTAFAITEDCFPGAKSTLRDGSVLFQDLMNPDMREVIALTAAIDPRCAVNISEKAISLLNESGRTREEYEALRSLVIQMIADEVSVSKEIIQKAMASVFESGILSDDINHIKQIVAGKYVGDLIEFFKKRDNQCGLGDSNWYSIIEILKNDNTDISSLCAKLRDSNDSLDKANALCAIAAYAWINTMDCLDELDASDRDYILDTAVDGLLSHDMRIVFAAFDFIAYIDKKYYITRISFLDYSEAIVRFINLTGLVPYIVLLDKYPKSEVIKGLNAFSLKLTEKSLRAIKTLFSKTEKIIFTNDYKIFLMILLICIFACNEEVEDLTVSYISEIKKSNFFKEYDNYSYFDSFAEYYQEVIACPAYNTVPKKVKIAFEKFGEACVEMTNARKKRFSELKKKFEGIEGFNT